MKDLKLNKESIVSLKESQLEKATGGTGGSGDIDLELGLEVTCRRKSCD